MASVRVVIIGAGALGTFYGSRLQAAGHEVHLLARSDAAVGRERGFRCHSALGDVTIAGDRVHAGTDTVPPCDMAVVALKTTDNHHLPTLLPPVLADTGVALVLQNGLGVEDAAAAVVGPERVYGGLCFLCANKVAPAMVEHLDYGWMALGRFAATAAAAPIDDRLRHIAAAFEAGGLRVELHDDLLLARWRKLVWNIPFNGLATVLDATTDHLLANDQVRELAAELMREVQAGAAAHGRHIPDSFLETMMADTAAMAPYAPSMLLDRRAGRPMEVRHIFHHPITAAAANGCPMPRTATLAAQLAFLDFQGGGTGGAEPNSEAGP